MTGVSASISSEALPLLERTRERTDLPLVLGFGLSTRQHMQEIAPHAEGAVVGSAFMHLITEHGDAPGLEDELEALAKDFKGGLQLPAQAGGTAAV